MAHSEMMMPLVRVERSLDDLDDTDTVEMLPSDSCSTLSFASQEELANGGNSSASVTVNDDERRLLRRGLHERAEFPEMQPLSQWLHGAELRTPSKHFLNASDWASEHPEYACVYVRWDFFMPSASVSRDGVHSYTTDWEPYAISSDRLFVAAANNTDTAAVVAGTSSGSGDSSSERKGSAQLRLGRGALLHSIHRLSLMSSRDGTHRAPDEWTDLVKSVSRAHCTLHVHFISHQQPLAPRHATLAAVCRSVDLFALTPTTTYCGMPLQPHYRYHLKSKARKGSTAVTEASMHVEPCDTNGMLSLRLGPFCRVDIALDNTPVAASARKREVPLSPPQDEAHLVERAQQKYRDKGVDVHRIATRTTVRATADTVATALPQRDSNVPPLPGESTVVLATLSDVSEPVFLSNASTPTSNGEHETASQWWVASSTAQETSALGREKRGAALLTKKSRGTTATVTNRKAAASARRRTTTVATLRSSSETDSEDAGPSSPPPQGVVLYTTGMRLSDGDEKSLKRLGALVNPHLRLAKHARLLIAQRPLVRSVKLLTVLPFIEDLVHASWLHAVLQAGDLNISCEDFRYGERRINGSIEMENDFSLHDVLRKSPAERQQLFAHHTFWVHPSAAPQDPPLNDLKTVITASGGTLTRRISEADVLLLPQRKLTLPCWRSIARQVAGRTSAPADAAILEARKKMGVMFVIPDDVFKCVLRQQPLCASTVALPRRLSGVANSSGGCGGGSVRPSTRGSRKTRRTSAVTPASSPRSSRQLRR